MNSHKKPKSFKNELLSKLHEDIDELYASVISDLKKKEKEVAHLPQIMAQNEALLIVAEENKQLKQDLSNMNNMLEEAHQKIDRLKEANLWMNALKSIDQEIW